MAVSPIDYLTGMGGLGPSYEDQVLGLQKIQENRNILAQQQAAAEAARVAQAQAIARAQRKRVDIDEVLRNPTAEGYARIQTLYPEDREAFKSAWETKSEDARKTDLRELGSLYGYLQSGLNDKAVALLERRIKADRAAGLDVADDEEMVAAIRSDPKRATGAVGYMLSSIVPPEQFGATVKNIGEEARADELQPGLVRKGIAEADKLETEAEYAPQRIESELASEAATRARQAAQTAIEQAQLELGWERLALDQDALATNTQLKLEQMLQSGQKVEGASLSELTKAVGSAQQNEALATRTRDLADRINASPMRGGGWRSSIGEAAAGMFGNQDAVTALRGQYEQIKNSQAIKNLPPGPATDRDIEIAMRGFPPANAGKGHIVNFLRGLAKLQDIAAAGDQRRADWISANGNLGTAKRDLDVGGVQVPAGTTFAEFNRNAGKVARRGSLPSRSYLEKYGK